MKFTVLAIVVLGILTIRGLELVQSQEPMVKPVEFKADFADYYRNTRFPLENFKLFGPDAAQRVKFEADGVHIELPGDQTSPEPLGLATTFNIHGDFEITANIEMVNAVQKSVSGGVAFELYLRTNSPKGVAIAFYHKIWPDGQPGYFAARNFTNDKGERGGTWSKRVPAVGKSGLVRVQRNGSEAVFFTAESAEKPFQELFRMDLGPEDVTLLRLGASPGGTENIFELRLLDLKVRAESLPKLSKTPQTIATGPTLSKLPKTPKIVATVPATKTFQEVPGVTTEFYEDFRNKKIDELQCKPTAFDMAKYMKCEPEGLRITLPASEGKHRETGVTPPLIVNGDFEITVGYEILEVQEGRRATFEIFLATKSPTMESLGIHRYIDSGSRFFGNRITTNAQDKRENVPGLDLGSSPYRAGAKSGYLRITRLGADAILAFADPGQPFKQLYQAPLGPEELSRLRIGVNPRNADFADVRLTDLRIKGVLTSTVEAVPLRGSSLWLVIAMVTALFVVAGVWLLVRRMRGMKRQETAD